MSDTDSKKENSAKDVDARTAEEINHCPVISLREVKTDESCRFLFGRSQPIDSTSSSSKTYTKISELCPDAIGQTILSRARVSAVRKRGKLVFVIFRSDGHSVQGVGAMSNGMPKIMIDFIGSVSCESVVDVEALVTKSEHLVASSTKQDIELQINKFHVVSEASARRLPFTFSDALENGIDGAAMDFNTRLNYRWMDLRTPASNAIMKIQSRICQHFRNFLIEQDFVEIHSPKLTTIVSGSVANVFKLDYFGKPAFLAPFPQLYQQMCIQGDLSRVFEVGPVFRCEHGNTHRHLTEFVGLNVEMVLNEHYYEIIDVAESLFFYIFSNLLNHETELDAVNAQYPFEPLMFQIPEEVCKSFGVGIIDDKVEPTDKYLAKVRNMAMRMLRIPYANCIELLNDNNLSNSEKLEPTDEINIIVQKKLCGLIKQRYRVDSFIVDRVPAVLRPFHTMLCRDDRRFAHAFEMFIRGEKMSSGAQRVHDSEILLSHIKDLDRCGVELAFKDYVDSFRLGAWPHGGFGIGLERVVMLYLGLKNIRYASLFPRDPSRITP